MFKYAFALIVLLTSACLVPHAPAGPNSETPPQAFTIYAWLLLTTDAGHE
ncbi:hypothetical protein ACVGWB_05075 [Enterobacter mori]